MCSLAVVDYTFSERASARERVCVCVCATVWGLTLPILVLAVSHTFARSLPPPPSPDGNRHTLKAADISVAWQPKYVAALSARLAPQSPQHNYISVLYQVYTQNMTYQVYTYHMETHRIDVVCIRDIKSI
jgi:hypothetical protein